LASAGRFEWHTPDGLVLRGELWGEGPLAMTFVHGAGLAMASYRPALAALAGQARVHALDARGHGVSDVPPDSRVWRPALEDLRAWVQSRLQPPVVLGGHSFGALLSLWLAAEAPELAAGLLLLDPLIPWRRDGSWQPAGEGPDAGLIAATRGRRDAWPSRAEAGDWLRARGVYRAWSEEAFAGFLASGLREAHDGTVTLACPPRIEAAIYLGRPGQEIFAWAERISVPAVILRGADSADCTAGGAEDLADAFPLGAVLTVKGTHTFPQEFPVETGRALAMALEILARCR
jgi:pimeloyl-ACP methyl ester carboxylesterase